MQEGRERIVAAIRRLREQRRWKPGKAERHLAKRVELGHLDAETTLAEYESLISHVVNTPTAEVFVYGWNDTVYPTVVAEVEGIRWLVMIGQGGVMETAFPPEEPEAYLTDPRFQRLGTLEELGL